MDTAKFLDQHMDLDQNDVARLSESLLDHPYILKRVRAVAEFHDSNHYETLRRRWLNQHGINFHDNNESSTTA